MSNAKCRLDYHDAQGNVILSKRIKALRDVDTLLYGEPMPDSVAYVVFWRYFTGHVAASLREYAVTGISDVRGWRALYRLEPGIDGWERTQLATWPRSNASRARWARHGFK